MKSLSIELENCYGIRRLETKLDFSGCKAFAIYAPNGVMKSSLAQTFRDLCQGVPSQDRIFPNRPTKRIIRQEQGRDVAPENVLVIAPFDETLGHTEKTSTLLVAPTLRKEYEQLHAQVDSAKAKLLAALKKQASTKKDVEVEISTLFTRRSDQFLVALKRIQSEVESQKDAPYADIDYDVLFDDKAQALLQESDFKAAVSDYVTKYNELLDASEYFDRDTFNYYNAGTIAKTLDDHGFFKAKHTVTLHGPMKHLVEIKNQKELTQVIEREKEAIIADVGLRDRFSKVQKILHKNAQVREFESYLMSHEGLLSKLSNPDAFKEDVWKSYMKANFDLFSDLLQKVSVTEKRRKEIEAEAVRQSTQWERVIEIFNERFFVPFKLVAENRTAVMLGQEKVLRLGFTFQDDSERAPVDKTTLMQVLSTGEKKAFYILNVIFEIETRAQSGVDTLLVVDDVADSFDYRNKYAIIQYLSELEKRANFEELLLTHNFDFYRTVESRFVSYKHCLMAEKTSAGIVLRQATGIKNVFVNDWKLNFSSDPKKRIASVPFIRNLLEYTKGDDDPDFVQLTSLLHWKADSAGIKQSELDLIYNRVFNQPAAYATPNEYVVNTIFREASACLTNTNSFALEDKVILAIATRLRAEQYMIRMIANTNYAGLISANQTQKLLGKFKEKFPKHFLALGVIDRVLLMTPENIHLNSFMYEPLIDMSGEHLRKLFSDVSDLDANTPTEQVAHR